MDVKNAVPVFWGLRFLYNGEIVEITYYKRLNVYPLTIIAL